MPAFLKNCWYVAALSSEVPADGVFHRKLLGSSVILYRKADGAAVVMRNRCPHRFAPLDRGRRIGDDLVCGYHGLRFDSAGRCVGSPHGDGSLPKGAAVETYPVEERDGYLWIWLGDKSAANPADIPDYSLISEGPANAVGYAYMHVPAHYEIVVDNILDLSHADFVHGPLLNTNGQLTRATPTVAAGKDSLTIRWEWRQSPAQGFFAQFLPEPDADAEQWVEVSWNPGASMYLHVGAVQGSLNYDEGLIFWANHIMTPETESTTHYFYGGRRNWLVDDADLNRALLAATVEAFRAEDTPIVAAIHQEMETSDLFALRPVILASDTAAVRVRRKLASMIRAEQSSNAPGQEVTP